MSGASGLAALCATYPNQVIRSRIQVTTGLFPLTRHDRLHAANRLFQNGTVLSRTHHCTISSTIAHTWAHEGLVGFYRGLATNIVRALPGTCITFVVYENLVWLLKRAASGREARASDGAKVSQGSS